MRSFLKFSVLFLVAGMASAYTIESILWTIADDYEVRFDGGGAKGTFTGLQGEILFDKRDLAGSKFDVSVATATIDTGNKTKDKHARSADWFDVAQYPTIRFESEEFTKTDRGYAVRGHFTLRGVRKPVTIPFVFTEYAGGGVFDGSITIDRQDYGLTGPGLRGKLVGDEFEVDIRVPVK